MNEDEQKAVWIALASLESANNIFSEITKLLNSCRELNDRTESSGEEFKYAKIAGQCQGSMDCVRLSVEIAQEKMKDGISAARYLAGLS